MIAHWDEVATERDLGQAAGALNVGLRRFELTPGETIEQGDPGAEEIAFVLAGLRLLAGARKRVAGSWRRLHRAPRPAHGQFAPRR